MKNKLTYLTAFLSVSFLALTFGSLKAESNNTTKNPNVSIYDLSVKMKSGNDCDPFGMVSELCMGWVTCDGKEDIAFGLKDKCTRYAEGESCSYGEESECRVECY